MTSLTENLQLFTDAVVSGTLRPPDNYPDWNTRAYAGHREDLLSLWSEIKPRLKRDLDKAAFVEEHLMLAIASFDRGEREPGQSLMVEIYNVLNLHKLR
jgi:hypothetical protein